MSFFKKMTSEKFSSPFFADADEDMMDDDTMDDQETDDEDEDDENETTDDAFGIGEE